MLKIYLKKLYEYADLIETFSEAKKRRKSLRMRFFPKNQFLKIVPYPTFFRKTDNSHRFLVLIYKLIHYKKLVLTRDKVLWGQSEIEKLTAIS